MSTNHTPNFNLCQWEATDKVLRTDFNEDNQKIDAALAGMGNCQIVSGHYIGTGSFGQNSPCSLTFDGVPAVLLMGGDNWTFFAVHGAGQTSAHYGENQGAWVYLTWNGNQVSWYNGDSADRQLNQKDADYYYVALLART